MSLITGILTRVRAEGALGAPLEALRAALALCDVLPRAPGDVQALELARRGTLSGYSGAMQDIENRSPVPAPIDAALHALDAVLREVVGRRDDFPDARELMNAAAHARRYMVAGGHDLARHEIEQVYALEDHAVLGFQRVCASADAVVRAVRGHGSPAARGSVATDRTGAVICDALARAVAGARVGIYTAQGPEVLERLLGLAQAVGLDPVREQRDDGSWVRVGAGVVLVADPEHDLAGSAR